MTDLNEGPLQYPEGINQIENGDPIAGGVPNIETGTEALLERTGR